MELERRAVFGWPATAAGYAPCDNGLVVHYDGSDQGLAGKSHQACRQYWKNTRKFHMNSRGWADIGYCVDEQTEILTTGGWRTFREIEPGDIALTLDHRAGMSQWQPVEEVYLFPAMPREMIRMQGRRHSSLTTPGHRWPVERPAGAGRGRERAWATTQTLTSHDLIPVAAECADIPAEPKWSDALVEALAWFWAPEQVDPEDSGRIPGAAVTVRRREGAEAARLRAALRALFGAPAQALPHGDDAPAWREVPAEGGTVVFGLSAAAGRLLLEHAPHRVVRHDFLQALTRAQLELFLQVSLRAGGRAAQRRFTRREEAEAFQFAAILAGRATSIQRPRPGEWVVRLRQETHVAPRRTGDFGITTERYDGHIWCVRTPNGTWLARRAGTVYFTGNSFAVCPHGIVMEGRGWQRVQAAQPGGNSTWTSVTFMSGPSEAPTRAQINAFKQLRAWLRGKGLKAGIRGHRDFISTSCPGEKLYALVKNGGLAGPPEQRPEEEDDVPIRTSLGKNKDQELAWGKWTRITWDVEHADPEGAHADGNYPGYVAPETSWADFHATVRVEGLQPGDEYQLRYEVHDWKDGKSTGKPWTEIHADHPATKGVQFVTGSCSKKLKKGQHAYVAIAVFPVGDTTGRPVPKAVSGRWTIRQDRA